MLVSSANFMALLRSLINIKNKGGPRTEPCGTLYFTEALLDTWQLMETIVCCHSFAITRMPDTAYTMLTNNKISCSTVSKAFYKSTKISHPKFPFSKFFVISSVRLIKTWIVKHCCLILNCSG